MSETVEVSVGAAQVETTSASLNNDFDSKDVLQVPVVGGAAYSALNLSILAPNTVAQPGGTVGVAVRSEGHGRETTTSRSTVWTTTIWSDRPELDGDLRRDWRISSANEYVQRGIWALGRRPVQPGYQDGTNSYHGRANGICRTATSIRWTI